MISVIIPTLNEEETIGMVVEFAFSHPDVNEVIVVDDQSQDNTVQIARQKGAHVITSSRIGKGASMKEGLQFARNEILLFLDGDIHPYPPNTITDLSKPLLSQEADFVKSAFSRNAGRVTELLAKPLLSIFFPELLIFSQPLSGMIAGKKSLMKELDFREDYGVDIGILIDLHLKGARILEAKIGYLENKSKPWQALGKMSRDVASTIILKAAKTGNPLYNLEELGTLSEIGSQLNALLNKTAVNQYRLVIFDMDDTLLKGRFIDRCAARFGFTEKLMRIRLEEEEPMVRTKKIARLLKGISYGEMIQVADTIPLVDDSIRIVQTLKQRGYQVGIISDSYDKVCEHIRIKAGMDFSVANELDFSKSICTGEVRIPSAFLNFENSVCKHTLCKTNAILHLLNKTLGKLKNTIVIGDSVNDLCMIKEAGIGIAFRSGNELVRHYADINLEEPAFEPLLEIAH